MNKKAIARFTLFLFISVGVQSTDILFAQQKLIPQIQKEILNKLIALLNDHYIFPEKAKEMGIHLQNKLNNGNYSKISDPKEFSRQITSDLQDISHDKHLTVEYSPQKVKELRAASSEPSEDERKEIEKKRYEIRRRDNFGFRKVEILEGNIGYMDLRSFRRTDDAANTAIGAMSFLSHCDAVIIDLRYNSGGVASMYLLLASYFFDSDMIHLSDLVDRLSVSTQQFRTLPYVSGQRMPDIDLYILTSNETFSAAEQFTYDLQCLKRAKVIGQVTGGGAHMVTRMILNDDFYMFMPFAGAINPITKTNWEGVGVKPDVEVPSEKALDEAYRLALKNLQEKTADQDWKKKLALLINNIEKKKEWPRS